MENELLSIIVPVYNVEGYLNRCVLSLVNQTYANKEIILVDDGSTDKSGIMCDEFAEKYSAIRVIHKKNGWQGEARNYGLDCCNGSYVSFVDPDDWLELDGCEKLIHELERTDADFVIGEFIIEYDDRTVPPRNTDAYEMNGHKAAYLNLNKNYICTNSSCNKIYKRDFIGNQRFPLKKKFEDTFFIHDALLKASKVYKTGIPFYHHYQRLGSTTHHIFSQWHFHLVEAYEAYYDRITDTYPELEPYCAARLVENSIYCINGALSSEEGDFSEKMAYYAKLIKKFPVFRVMKYKDAAWTYRLLAQHLIIKLSFHLYKELHKCKRWMANYYKKHV